MTWQVFTRLVLSNPSIWSEEAARYVFIWLSLIGISIATGEKADVAIDYFVQKAPLAAQRVLEIVAYLATLTFALLVMVWGGYLNASQTMHQLNPVLPISAGVLYLAVPISGVLLTFYLVYHLIRTLSLRLHRGRAHRRRGRGGAVNDVALVSAVMIGGMVLLMVIGAPISISIGLPSAVSMILVLGLENGATTSAQRMFTGSTRSRCWPSRSSSSPAAS